MSVPAKTSFKTTSFGVRARDLVIVGVAGFLGLAILALPVGSILVRIIVAAALAAGGVGYAYQRIRKFWSPEEYFFNRLKFFGRARRFSQGGVVGDGAEFGAVSVEQAQEAAPEPVPDAAGAPAAPAPARPRRARAASRALFYLPDYLVPQTDAELLGTMLAVFAVVAFLGWVATTGGVASIQAQLQVLWFAIISG